VSLAQEALHSIKRHKISFVVLKLDLSKACDKVNWTFHWLALIRLGINMEMVNWILDCVESTSFVIQINGSPSSFFNSSRGLHRGFPLSPFLFLILAKGLSKLLQNEKRSGVLKGLKILKSIFKTRLLFVYNIMLFGVGSLQEFKAIKYVLDMFCLVTCMEINMVKYVIHTYALSEEAKAHIRLFLPFAQHDIDVGLRYIGFHLKLNLYVYEDWLWLFKKNQSRISLWVNQWLSKGGRLVLINFLLSSISVY